MTFTRIARALLLLVIGTAAAVRTVSGSDDDTLAHAKGLYASAAYDEALAVLDRLQSATPLEDPTSVAEYTTSGRSRHVA